MHAIRFALVSVLLVSLACAASASAQTTAKLLLPIVPGSVVGANGSEWLTELTITNLSDDDIMVRYGEIYCPGQCLPVPVAPHSTVVSQSVISSPAVRGRFMTMAEGAFSDLAITLRTRDLSKQAETWGTVLPVVSEEDLYSKTFGLTDVPAGDGFRSMLRVYDVDARTPPNVRVRIYRLNPLPPGLGTPNSDSLLMDFVPVFALPPSGVDETLYPASFEFPLWIDPALSGSDRLRIEIEPLDGRAEYWAFASITHNETQHVTIVAP
jgi:hypothetical protein